MKHSDLHPIEVLALAAMAIAWAAWTLARVLIVPLLALLIAMGSYRAREPERSCRPWEPSSPAVPRSHAPRPAPGPGGPPAGADRQWAPNLPPTAPLDPPAQPLGITGSGQELVEEVGIFTRFSRKEQQGSPRKQAVAGVLMTFCSLLSSRSLVRIQQGASPHAAV